MCIRLFADFTIIPGHGAKSSEMHASNGHVVHFPPWPPGVVLRRPASCGSPPRRSPSCCQMGRNIGFPWPSSGFGPLFFCVTRLDATSQIQTVYLCCEWMYVVLCSHYRSFFMYNIYIYIYFFFVGKCILYLSSLNISQTKFATSIFTLLCHKNATLPFVYL